MIRHIAAQPKPIQVSFELVKFKPGIRVSKPCSNCGVIHFRKQSELCSPKCVLAVRRKRWKQNPEYVVKNNLRSRITSAIRAAAYAVKSDTTANLVGCGMDELCAWLERHFTPGMTWENYGEWHIDHIKPCAAYDLTDPLQQRLCFHYTNLQPLWALENLLKGDKL